jgi:hypothetical protein
VEDFFKIFNFFHVQLDQGIEDRKKKTSQKPPFSLDDFSK